MADIPWDDYKHLLRRAYFGDYEGSIAPRESDLCRDFWIFHKKYVEMAVRKVPASVVAEFEFILAAYFQFCQKQKFTKLKQLRDCQQQLPIATKREDILEALESNNTLIIAGDTGCGKSTQVPQYLLSAGYTNIACTQPRRIACISLSKRVAFETLNEFATRIAYAIRFEKTRTLATRMLFLTEGLLLRQMSVDPQLNDYQVIMLDEVHERHLHGDLLIGLLKMMSVQRETPLKLILMSATINLELFKAYFPDAPVIQVPGRLYPIQTHYLPVQSQAERDFSRDITKERKKDEKKVEKIDPAPYQRVLQMIDGKYPASERGDILVFLSGINEMQTVGDVLKTYAEQTKKWIILMLHSTLSLEEQDRVFDIAPDGVRKCVLSTNIGETSVTIDGIRFVVDSGKVKQMTYDAECRTHQLKEIWVSKASAEQRKGRAGRTGPGVCYRLYSDKDYDKFDEYNTAEIHRVSLESVAMQIYNLDLGVNPRDFPFIEKPDPTRLTQAIECLRDQRALEVLLNVKPTATTNIIATPIDGDEPDIGPEVPCAPVEQLTSLGKVLVNLPVDVEIGKMLVVACLFGQMEAILTMAAGLSVQSIFTQRSYRDPDCQTARQALVSDHGDAFTLVNTYREWIRIRVEGQEYTRRWCRQRGIEEQRLYDISKLRQQFADLLVDADLTQLNLLASHKNDAKNSHERRLRAGELQRLRDMKRKARNDQRKRKVLRRDQHFDTIDSVASDSMQNIDEDADGSAHRDERKGDVHALEFDMRHGDAELMQVLEAHKLSHQRAILLKFVVCSGLYPLYGILDPFNNYKPGNDLFVHTLSKQYCVLHPNGCLANDPETLAHTVDTHKRAETHQLIFFSMLLETTKPYLVNCTRVPALQTLLLVSRKVDIASDYSNVVCDDFVEFTVDDEGRMPMQMVTAAATALRRLMRSEMDEALDKEKTTKVKRPDLTKQLMKYFDMNLMYTMKRMTHSERERQLLAEERRLADDADIDTFRVGTVNSSLLANATTTASYAEFISTKWTCQHCTMQFYSTAAQKEEHEKECQGLKMFDDVADETEETATVPIEDTDPNLREYTCDVCHKTMRLKPIDILRHRRECR